jgi:hypothetical protein
MSQSKSPARRVLATATAGWLTLLAFAALGCESKPVAEPTPAPANAPAGAAGTGDAPAAAKDGTTLPPAEKPE